MLVYLHDRVYICLRRGIFRAHWNAPRITNRFTFSRTRFRVRFFDVLRSDRCKDTCLSGQRASLTTALCFCSHTFCLNEMFQVFSFFLVHRNKKHVAAAAETTRRPLAAQHAAAPGATLFLSGLQSEHFSSSQLSLSLAAVSHGLMRGD